MACWSVFVRRWGRPIWVPARLLWLPLLAVGATLLVGLELNATRFGPGEFRVTLVQPSPSHWFDEPLRAAFGVVLTLGGLVLFALTQWRPDPADWRFVTRHYSVWSWASAAWAVLFLLSMVSLGEHTVRGASGGVLWRFVATVRDGPADWVWRIGAAAGFLICFTLSFGREPWRPATRHRAPSIPAPR